MGANSFSHIANRIRAGVKRNLLNGISLSTSQGLAMAGSTFAGGTVGGALRRVVVTSAMVNPIAICEIAVCEDVSTCGV